MGNQLPDDSAARKNMPMAAGLLDYFPDALAYVAYVSKVGNDKHNPGQELHWSRGKSTDHADCIVRHLVDRGKLDGAGVRHSGALAWRALALLQEELEAAKVANGEVPAAVAAYPRGARDDRAVPEVGSSAVTTTITTTDGVRHTFMWNDGTMPVTPRTMVEVSLANGKVMREIASALFWARNGSEQQIDWWRLCTRSAKGDGLK